MATLFLIGGIRSARKNWPVIDQKATFSSSLHHPPVKPQLTVDEALQWTVYRVVQRQHVTFHQTQQIARQQTRTLQANVQPELPPTDARHHRRLFISAR